MSIRHCPGDKIFIDAPNNADVVEIGKKPVVRNYLQEFSKTIKLVKNAMNKD